MQQLRGIEQYGAKVILRVVELPAFVNCFRSLEIEIDRIKVSLLTTQGML